MKNTKRPVQTIIEDENGLKQIKEQVSALSFGSGISELKNCNVAINQFLKRCLPANMEAFEVLKQYNKKVLNFVIRGDKEMLKEIQDSMELLTNQADEINKYKTEAQFWEKEAKEAQKANLQQQLN